MKEINVAYDVLSDPIKRAQHDRELAISSPLFDVKYEKSAGTTHPEEAEAALRRARKSNSEARKSNSEEKTQTAALAILLALFAGTRTKLMLLIASNVGLISHSHGKILRKYSV